VGHYFGKTRKVESFTIFMKNLYLNI